MFRTVFIAAFLAFGVISVSSSILSSNDLTVGARQSNDKLVYDGIIDIPASWIGRKVIHEQTFNATLSNHIITQLRALDLAENDTGASVIVTAGGPGHESMTLRFKSQRLRGIYFRVLVFAKSRY